MNDKKDKSTENQIKNKSIENEIKKAFQRITSGIYPELFNTLTISEDYQASTEILIDDLVPMISKSQVLACFILEDESGRKIIECNNRFIFANIKFYIRKHQFINDIYSGFVFSRFNLYEDLFIRNVNEIFALKIGEYLNSDPDFPDKCSDFDLVQFCGMFNHFFERIKKEAKSPEFKIALALYQDQ
jgi:hypothetical protein